MKKYLFLPFLIILFTIGCKDKPLPTQAKINEYSINYQCQAGKNAFDLLLDNTTSVDYENSDFGVFIKSINDIANDNTQQKYWLYTIDGETALTAIDQYSCKNNEIIEWQYGAEFNN